MASGVIAAPGAMAGLLFNAATRILHSTDATSAVTIRGCVGNHVSTRP